MSHRVIRLPALGNEFDDSSWGLSGQQTTCGTIAGHKAKVSSKTWPYVLCFRDHAASHSSGCSPPINSSCGICVLSFVLTSISSFCFCLFSVLPFSGIVGHGRPRDDEDSCWSSWDLLVFDRPKHQAGEDNFKSWDMCSSSCSMYLEKSWSRQRVQELGSLEEVYESKHGWEVFLVTNTFGCTFFWEQEYVVKLNIMICQDMFMNKGNHENEVHCTLVRDWIKATRCSAFKKAQLRAGETQGQPSPTSSPRRHFSSLSILHRLCPGIWALKPWRDWRPTSRPTSILTGWQNGADADMFWSILMHNFCV